MLQIVRASDAVLEAHVLRGNREITDERPASAFNWTRSSGDAIADATWNNAHRSMKQITLTTAEINGNMQFSCAYTETEGSYGTVQVNDSLMASHTPATADANDVFTIENGMLKVTTSTTNGTDYALNAGTLSVNNGFTGTLTSTATFNNDVQTREIDFIYDHNGMRTAKIVSENGRVEMTEYTLHGKLITHLTKRTVDENGAESTEELHFFYDAQSRPAFVEYDGAMYRYIHNLQSDIVAIVDTVGNPVVEYKYDAWGKSISITGSLKTSLGQLNPFRYRGYVWNEETELYYLKNRYYCVAYDRFLNMDTYLDAYSIGGHNLFAYCKNVPILFFDPSGKLCEISAGPVGNPKYTVTEALLRAGIPVTKVYKETKELAYGPLETTTIVRFIPTGSREFESVSSRQRQKEPSGLSLAINILPYEKIAEMTANPVLIALAPHISMAICVGSVLSFGIDRSETYMNNQLVDVIDEAKKSGTGIVHVQKTIADLSTGNMVSKESWENWSDWDLYN